MKSLVNLQSKKQITTAVTEQVSDEPIKELFVRKKPAKKQQQKEIDLIKELPKSRSTRLTSNTAKNKRVSNAAAAAAANKINTTTTTTKRTNAKTSNNSKSSSTTTVVAITKTKSRRKLGRAKSKTVNMINLAKSKAKLQNSISMPAVVKAKTKTATTSTNKRSRKRKISLNEDDIEGIEDQLETETISTKSLAPSARKSSRLSKDTTNQNSQQNTLKSKTLTTRKKSTVTSSLTSFSPPLTRSRLKHLEELGKITNTTTAVAPKPTARKRRI